MNRKMKSIFASLIIISIIISCFAGCSNSKKEETTTAIDILGTIHKDGKFDKRPWYTYEADKENLNGKDKGEYSIVQKDSGGKELSKVFFDISFKPNNSPTKTVEFMPVNVTIAYFEKAKTIEIFKKDASVYKVDITDNKPEVSFGSMADTYSGKTEISWTASDKDNDKLFYEVWYIDNEDFISLATDLEEAKLTVDFDKLPGSDNASFVVYATDGINTTEAESAAFKVGYKPPEIISEQKKIPEYKITDDFTFDAEIYDMQDGWLDDDAVTWKLKGKEFTTGSSLWVWPYELTPGTHVFTLSAKNSKGLEATKEFSFKIIDDESALPNDWSKDDVKKALSNGFIAPLKNVNSAITRGQYAKLMANLYWALHEDGSDEPEYKENVVKDCGNDDFDQFLMVSLGVMEAKDGKFNPNGNLTQEEAAVIMYRICNIANPGYLDKSIDPKGIINAFNENSVIDESGDNAYNAAAKITGRLALVRCNRLYEAIFEE